MGSKAAAVLMVIVLMTTPLDVPPQCAQPVYARANPGICFDTPFPDLGGGSSSDGGGILGGIGRVLHHLTGGLL